VVAQRTGLSTHVLRAWERRYHVVAPTRTDGGQRLYTDADIERLALLRTLTSHGGAISQLAQLPHGELARMVQEDRAAHTGRSEPGAEPDPAAARRREAALRAIESLDGAGLRRQLERGVVALGVPRFLDHVVAPVLIEIGQRWRSGELAIGHEHLATAAIRQVLGWVQEAAETGGGTPALVVATPPNQIHEGGIMLVAATAATEGWRVVYLGVNLPAAEIAAAALRTRARAVALSLIHPADDPTLGAQLRALRQALPADLPLLIGGGAAESYRGAIEAADGEIVTELADLRSALGALAMPE
jgi:DNA-binding transcriptional MerR regulator/methylmalonyl-CoA mutase cobalamin-binding subunit